MCAALAEGTTRVERFLLADDCLRTISALQAWGAEIISDADAAVVTVTRGIFNASHPPQGPVDVGNSGTSMRVLAGIAAGQPFPTEFTGDASLSQRPMRRIAEPLSQMGARITGRELPERPGELFPPLTVAGGTLQPIHYTVPVASAQVKSALLLASLFTDGTTTITEPQATRDHTERLLQRCGVQLAREDQTVRVTSTHRALRSPGTLRIPGDLSSAAFWLVAASLLPKSSVTLHDVGVNPTRTGILDILRYMGANVTLAHREDRWEPRGDLLVEAAALRATVVRATMVPRSIDELPILMVAATQAEGVTEFHGIEELRLKETDRIRAMVEGLTRLGAKIGVHHEQPLPAGAPARGEPLGNVVVIEGPTTLHGAEVDSVGDHRTAMSLAVAGLLASGQTVVRGVESVQTSYPAFFEDLQRLGASVALSSKST